MKRSGRNPTQFTCRLSALITAPRLILAVAAQEIDALQQQLQAAELAKDKKSEEVEGIRVYEQFIETVVEHSDEYQEISVRGNPTVAHPFA